jgi:hypothetical protein
VQAFGEVRDGDIRLGVGDFVVASVEVEAWTGNSACTSCLSPISAPGRLSGMNSFIN